MDRILIVEDEAHIADGLKFNLEAEGFDAEIAQDGQLALEMIGSDSYDVVVLDVMLPKLDGFEVARALRERQDFTPILMLTARSRPEDVLEGFAAGADDYLAKPFELDIFIARLRGLLRRRGWAQQDKRSANDTYEFGDKKIDFKNLELKTKDETVHLTLMEANLLRHFIEKKGEAVSRKEILEEVWGLSEDTDTRAIDNFVVRLRRYIEENPARPKILITVRGVGYKFDVN